MLTPHIYPTYEQCVVGLHYATLHCHLPWISPFKNTSTILASNSVTKLSGIIIFIVIVIVQFRIFAVILFICIPILRRPIWNVQIIQIEIRRRLGSPDLRPITSLLDSAVLNREYSLSFCIVTLIGISRSYRFLSMLCVMINELRQSVDDATISLIRAMVSSFFEWSLVSLDNISASRQVLITSIAKTLWLFRLGARSISSTMSFLYFFFSRLNALISSLTAYVFTVIDVKWRLFDMFHLNAVFEMSPSLVCAFSLFARSRSTLKFPSSVGLVNHVLGMSLLAFSGIGFCKGFS